MRGDPAVLGCSMTCRLSCDLPDAWFDSAEAMCGRLGADLVDVLGVMNAESGVSAAACNLSTHAAGFIQIMPANFPAVGWHGTVEEFIALSPAEQLPFAEHYLASYAGKLTSAAACYLAVFLPAFIDHATDPDYVLAAKRGKLGRVYEANAVFDVSGPEDQADGLITVRELELAIQRNAATQRFQEILTRAHRSDLPGWAVPDLNDLRTLIGQQHALVKLGFDLGVSGVNHDGVDGVPGRKTQNAILAFRLRSGLPSGTNVGPRTQAALRAALAAA